MPLETAREAGWERVPISQIKTLRPREVKQLARSHPAAWQQEGAFGLQAPPSRALSGHGGWRGAAAPTLPLCAPSSLPPLSHLSGRHSAPTFPVPGPLVAAYAILLTACGGRGDSQSRPTREREVTPRVRLQFLLL